MIQENAILNPVSEGVKWTQGRCRFLGLDSSGFAVLMPMDKKRLGPLVCEFAMVLQALEDGLLQEAKLEEPPMLPDDLSPKARKHYNFWKVYFVPVLNESRDALLEKDFRVAAVAAIARASGRPPSTVRRMLYRVLRSGRNLLGLCPNFSNRGAPGRPQRKGTKKRGRKPLPGNIASQVTLPNARTILEEAVRKLVIQGGGDVDESYYKMLGEHFTKTVVEENGKVSTHVFKECDRPSLNQFRRVAQQLLSTPNIKSPKRGRPGTAKDGLPGPGYHYEIDATGARLELVSEFDLSQPIGSANAYGVIDVATTLCVGGTMGVFNAGYQAAQIALFNTFTSKRDFCARWDIEIEEDAWPCAHICRYLTSDRGELVSDAAEALPEELNVVVRTAPPYRPEAKGTVEGWFGLFKASDIRKMVGFGRKTQRGERNPREQAALTRYDAMRAFIISALRYNHQPAPESAIPPEMLEHGYEYITRTTLWQWLMNNRVTGARKEDPGLIYTAMLRKVSASIRANGLFIGPVRYMSPELRVSGLLQRASNYGSIEVEATLDEFAARTIWYRTSAKNAWSPAYLADESLLLYDATYEELTEYFRRRKAVHDRTRVESSVFDRHSESALLQISEEATIRQGGERPRAKVHKGVRSARAVDMKDERREHGLSVVGSYQGSNAASVKSKLESTKIASSLEVARLDITRALFLEPEEP